MNFWDLTIGIIVGWVSCVAIMLLLIRQIAKGKLNKIMRQAHAMLEGVDEAPEELNYDKKMEEEAEEDEDN